MIYKVENLRSLKQRQISKGMNEIESTTIRLIYLITKKIAFHLELGKNLKNVIFLKKQLEPIHA